MQALNQCSSDCQSTRPPIAAIPSCSILDNNETDALDLKRIANEFVACYSSIQNTFGYLGRCIFVVIYCKLGNFRVAIKKIFCCKWKMCFASHCFCGTLILCYLLNNKLIKHSQTKNVAYGHATRQGCLQRSICKSWRWAHHNCRNYGLLVKWASVHLRFPCLRSLKSGE